MTRLRSDSFRSRVHSANPAVREARRSASACTALMRNSSPAIRRGHRYDVRLLCAADRTLERPCVRFQATVAVGHERSEENLEHVLGQYVGRWILDQAETLR